MMEERVEGKCPYCNRVGRFTLTYWQSHFYEEANALGWTIFDAEAYFKVKEEVK